jgi:hypothetical protein
MSAQHEVGRVGLTTIVSGHEPLIFLGKRHPEFVLRTPNRSMTRPLLRIRTDCDERFLLIQSFAPPIEPPKMLARSSPLSTYHSVCKWLAELMKCRSDPHFRLRSTLLNLSDTESASGDCPLTIARLRLDSVRVLSIQSSNHRRAGLNADELLVLSFSFSRATNWSK